MASTLKNRIYIYYLPFIIFFFFFRDAAHAQTSAVLEETREIRTYPFFDPDPVPTLLSDPKIYPYHTFDGYSHTGEKMPWKVIRLENKYIQVFILPEVGGKVWGAIDKTTGNEFIYYNEVLKFRNIAMRGPWTSGGIEFNFGIIGHNPSTASEVDYVIRENDDGSVSCFVGNMDLPSRSHWRVEIRLPGDKSYFETRALWYNPTPLTQSYYNWMTASAVAREDLEFFIPGNTYLTHGGEPKSWPVDEEGRQISYYKNNKFGSSKSYHVTGVFEEFFGGYYHDSGVGFGHWATYEEMPGHKLWLWALSRSGGIWEDLLTDTDSQYIEFQAGRLFNQYSPGSHQNPIRQVGFAPYQTDQWTETWFPFKQINGMTDASPYGVMNITGSNDRLEIGIDPLQAIDDTLLLRSDNKILFKEYLNLEPRQVYSKQIGLNELSGNWEVILGNRKLYYTSNQDSLMIRRPFQRTDDYILTKQRKLFNEGLDALYFREYKKAAGHFNNLLKENPSHVESILALGELNYRKGEYDSVLFYANRVLMQNTYDTHANYLAGLGYRAKNDMINALESMGWAARSVAYRSAAYTQMAEIYVSIGRLTEALEYASKALDFNQKNINARLVRLVASRKTGDIRTATETIQKLLEIDPLNHFTRFENYLLEDSPAALDKFKNPIKNEFAEETYLETALYYHQLNLNQEAIQVLTLARESVKNKLWLAYLYRLKDPEISHRLLSECISSSPEFVFPYRKETINALTWAKSQMDSWKLDYFLALNYAAINKHDIAIEFLENQHNEPDFWPFYVTRAELLIKDNKETIENDLIKAWELAPESWRTWYKLINFYEENHMFEKAVEMARKAYMKFPDNYTIGFLYAKALLNTDKYESCIGILMELDILPFEGSYESRLVYEKAHLMLAMDLIRDKAYYKAIRILEQALEWPENIGVGKPYDPDQRRQEFLLGYCYQQTGDKEKFMRSLNYVIDYTKSRNYRIDNNHLLGLLSMKITGRAEANDDLYERIAGSLDLPTEVSQWISDLYQKDELHFTDIFTGDKALYHLAEIYRLNE